MKMASRRETPTSNSSQDQSTHTKKGPTKPNGHTCSQESPDGKVETVNGRSLKRTVKEHSFLTDVADVRAMEQGLVHLLEDFHSGKLQAFGGDCMFDRMDQIREQQERLARLHFDVDLHHHVLRLDTEDSRKRASENLNKLIAQLQSLSSSIQTLQKSDVQINCPSSR